MPAADSKPTSTATGLGGAFRTGHSFRVHDALPPVVHSVEWPDLWIMNDSGKVQSANAPRNRVFRFEYDDHGQFEALLLDDMVIATLKDPQVENSAGDWKVFRLRADNDDTWGACEQGSMPDPLSSKFASCTGKLVVGISREMLPVMVTNIKGVPHASASDRAKTVKEVAWQQTQEGSSHDSTMRLSNFRLIAPTQAFVPFGQVIPSVDLLAPKNMWVNLRLVVDAEKALEEGILPDTRWELNKQNQLQDAPIPQRGMSYGLPTHSTASSFENERERQRQALQERRPVPHIVRTSLLQTTGALPDDEALRVPFFQLSSSSQSHKLPKSLQNPQLRDMKPGDLYKNPCWLLADAFKLPVPLLSLLKLPRPMMEGFRDWLAVPAVQTYGVTYAGALLRFFIAMYISKDSTYMAEGAIIVKRKRGQLCRNDHEWKTTRARGKLPEKLFGISQPDPTLYALQMDAYLRGHVEHRAAAFAHPGIAMERMHWVEKLREVPKLCTLEQGSKWMAGITSIVDGLDPLAFVRLSSPSELFDAQLPYPQPEKASKALLVSALTSILSPDYMSRPVVGIESSDHCHDRALPTPVHGLLNLPKPARSIDITHANLKEFSATSRRAPTKLAQTAMPAWRAGTLRYPSYWRPGSGRGWTCLSKELEQPPQSTVRAAVASHTSSWASTEPPLNSRGRDAAPGVSHKRPIPGSDGSPQPPKRPRIIDAVPGAQHWPDLPETIQKQLSDALVTYQKHADTAMATYQRQVNQILAQNLQNASGVTRIENANSHDRSPSREPVSPVEVIKGYAEWLAQHMLESNVIFAEPRLPEQLKQDIASEDNIDRLAEVVAQRLREVDASSQDLEEKLALRISKHRILQNNPCALACQLTKSDVADLLLHQAGIQLPVNLESWLTKCDAVGQLPLGPQLNSIQVRFRHDAVGLLKSLRDVKRMRSMDEDIETPEEFEKLCQEAAKVYEQLLQLRDEHPPREACKAVLAEAETRGLLKQAQDATTDTDSGPDSLSIGSEELASGSEYEPDLY